MSEDVVVGGGRERMGMKKGGRDGRDEREGEGVKVPEDRNDSI